MGDATTLFVAGALVLGGYLAVLVWYLRRTSSDTSTAPPGPAYTSDDFYQLRTQVQALERQVQDVELTIEARHRKVCGMISGERGAALTEVEAEPGPIADQIRANLAGDGGAAPVAAPPQRRLRKRR